MVFVFWLFRIYYLLFIIYYNLNSVIIFIS
jgi:hypothetical protein